MVSRVASVHWAPRSIAQPLNVRPGPACVQGKRAIAGAQPGAQRDARGPKKPSKTSDVEPVISQLTEHAQPAGLAPGPGFIGQCVCCIAPARLHSRSSRRGRWSHRNEPGGGLARARVSSERQPERRAGRERQALAAACKQRGWQPLESVDEAGLAAQERNAPGLEQALGRARRPARERAAAGLGPGRARLRRACRRRRPPGSPRRRRAGGRVRPASCRFARRARLRHPPARKRSAGWAQRSPPSRRGRPVRRPWPGGSRPAAQGGASSVGCAWEHVNREGVRRGR